MIPAKNLLKIAAVSDTELEITRDFNAPRKLVFDAMTKPELLRRWFNGPPGWTLSVCEFDARPGGRYRYVWTKQGGIEMGMGGEILEIVEPKKIVATEEFDQSWYPGNAIDTSILTERDGKTTLTLIVKYESPEALQAVLKSPMESGMSYGYDRLEELLAELV